MRPAVFWDFTQCRMAVSYRRLGTIYWSHLQGSSGQKECRERLGAQFVTCVYTRPPLTCQTALRYLVKGFILKPTVRTHPDILKISNILRFICIRTGLILSRNFLLVILYISKTYFNFVLSYSLF
jgi:hypothetical protein